MGKEQRNQAALQKFRSDICAVMVCSRLKEMVKKMVDIKPKVRLVFSLDEMGGFPIFVRALIAERNGFADVVLKALTRENGQMREKVVVWFSVAGTGASSRVGRAHPELQL